MKRKRKPSKPIPNAEGVGEAIAAAWRLGRTSGILESLADQMEACVCRDGETVALDASNCALVAPLLRAESERLRSART